MAVYRKRGSRCLWLHWFSRCYI